MHLKLLAVTALAVALSGCASFDIEKFTAHMEKRKCASSGRVDLHPVTIPTSKMTGYVAWRCGDGQPDDTTPADGQ